MQVAPSILNADFGTLQSELDSIAAADRVHLDVMDYKYVPNMSFGASILKNIRFKSPTEVHLMTDNPENYVKDFIALGVMGITFHIENTGLEKAKNLLKKIQKEGIKAGICLDGYTSTDFLDEEILEIADQILVMSVKAGFGGQKFMNKAIEKVKTLRNRGYKGEIEVDGGVNLDNAPLLKAAGADIVVVGSYLMKNEAEKRESVIKDFQSL